MMGGFDQGPLTDEEIEELDQFLLDAKGIEESMDVSALDGFLTAIVSGPKTIMPSAWMRWVWDMERGEDTPAFKDQAQAQRIIGFLMRHMNDIARTLQQAPDQYEPLLMENPEQGRPCPHPGRMVYGLHDRRATRSRGLAAGHGWQTRLAVDHHPLWHR